MVFVLLFFLGGVSRFFSPCRPKKSHFTTFLNVRILSVILPLIFRVIPWPPARPGLLQPCHPGAPFLAVLDYRQVCLLPAAPTSARTSSGSSPGPRPPRTGSSLLVGAWDSSFMTPPWNSTVLSGQVSCWRGSAATQISVICRWPILSFLEAFRIFFFLDV